MSSDASATTTVRIELTGRRATIEDVQDALDTLRREGIPETFEISLHQSQDREYIEGVPYAERPVAHSLWVEAARAAAA